MSDLKKYITKRLKTDPEFADGFETGYADFKQTVLQEIAREQAGIKMAVKLGQWLQHNC
jgi:hypothetical protein